MADRTSMMMSKLATNPAQQFDPASLGQEIHAFWRRRLGAYGQVWAEASRCRTVGELWQVQAAFGGTALKDYHDEAIRLAAMAGGAAHRGAAVSATSRRRH
jgi:hypothetical protein